MQPLQQILRLSFGLKCPESQMPPSPLFLPQVARGGGQGGLVVVLQVLVKIMVPLLLLISVVPTLVLLVFPDED